MQSAAPTPPPPQEAQQQSRNGGNGSCKRVDAEFSVYVGNLDPDTSVEDMEELLYELFLQAGPLSKVYVPFSQESDRHKGYAFVEFQHVESVSYSLQLMGGIRLCGRVLNLAPATPALPPSSSSSSSVTTCSVSTSGNPFVSAFQSHVAQKEAEMVAANPFLSSLNTHLGGPPLPPPPLPSSLPPPPSSLPPPPPLPLPLPPLLPPPGLPPPIFPLPTPPPSLPPPPQPLLPNLPPPPSTPLPQPPPLSLPTPPPIIPPSIPPPLLSLPSLLPSTPLPYPPPPLPSLLPLPPPPVSTPLSTTIPSLFPPTSIFKTVISTTAAPESDSPTMPLSQFGILPPPHGEPNSDQSGTVSLSLAQTVTEMAMNSTEDTTFPATTTEESSGEQYAAASGTVSTGYDASVMENCPMSLEVCLDSSRDDSGSGAYSPSSLAVSGADRNGFQLELERQSWSGNGPLSDTSGTKHNPFSDDIVVPYPCGDQISNNEPNNGMVPHPSDDQIDNGVAPYPGDGQINDGLAPYPSDDRINDGVVPYPGDDQIDHSVAPYPGDDQIDDGVAPYPGDDQIDHEPHPNQDNYMDSNGLSQYNGYVNFSLPRKHGRFETEGEENYHDIPPNGPFHDGPPPSEVPLDYQPFGPPPTKLHRSRLGTRDHPSWLSRETRHSIQQYHLGQLQRLQNTIGQLKEAIMIERANSPLSSHFPSQ